MPIRDEFPTRRCRQAYRWYKASRLEQLLSPAQAALEVRRRLPQRPAKTRLRMREPVSRTATISTLSQASIPSAPARGFSAYGPTSLEVAPERLVKLPIPTCYLSCKIVPLNLWEYPFRRLWASAQRRRLGT